MPGLNGSSGSRPAPVVRSAAGRSAIMADFERSGMSRREFCASRGLSPKTFGSRRSRLGRTGAGAGFVEIAPPAASGRDVGPGPGDGVVLRVRRLAAGRHPAVDGAGRHAAQLRRAVRAGRDPSRARPGRRPMAIVRQPAPHPDQGPRLRAGRLPPLVEAPGAGPVRPAAGDRTSGACTVVDRAGGADRRHRRRRPPSAQALRRSPGGVRVRAVPHDGRIDAAGHRPVGEELLPQARRRFADPVGRAGVDALQDVCRMREGADPLHEAGGDEAVGDARVAPAGLGPGNSRLFCPSLMRRNWRPPPLESIGAIGSSRNAPRDCRRSTAQTAALRIGCFGAVAGSSSVRPRHCRKAPASGRVRVCRAPGAPAAAGSGTSSRSRTCPRPSPSPPRPAPDGCQAAPRSCAWRASGSSAA